MKKSSLWILVLVVGISMIITFSFAGCKAPVEEVAPVEEEVAPAEEEVVEEEVIEEEAEEVEIHTAIKVFSLPWPQTGFEQQLADEVFTPATGIKVELVGPPYEFAEVKLREFAAIQSDEYDVYEYDSQWIGDLVSKGALERLDTEEYLLSPDVTISFSDFEEGYLTYIGKFPCKPEVALRGNWQEYENLPLYGLPWYYGVGILGYRTDLFIEAGIVDEDGNPKPPKTWPEFLVACQKLTDPDAGRYGIAWYNGRMADAISMQALTFVFSYGGSLWNPDTFEAEGYINSPESIAGFEEFCKYNLEYKVIDPAAANWFIDELITAVTQDKAAMWFTYGCFAAVTEDENTSLTVGKWDYAPIPGHPDNIDPETGEVHPDPMIASQGVGINAFSENKEAAWKYIQWLKSYETEKALLDLNPISGFASARKDLADIEATIPFNKATHESMQYCHDYWNYPFYGNLLDYLQREMSLAYIGAKTPKEALDAIATYHQGVMDTEKATYLE